MALIVLMASLCAAQPSAANQVSVAQLSMATMRSIAVSGERG
eukprot:CAMPEP_0202070136 /NCGR_PEP_ID=MMETSP0964-20121228/969_1 /ASSEMBLY_ACC=CAM_ASM_000500 /TAXON_ID=4773 /ORGANISM="Schizochytrium aggregatum, Strain ATCC28209" /LENGTH=41 /DNA_ID= /DNA_START= /DNA_END= /DNA_ORIENTATION=